MSGRLNVEYVLNGLESLFPNANLLLNLNPFFLVDLSDSSRLDDYLLVELVDFCVDNAMAHCFDDPLLNIIFIDIKQFCNLLECLFSLLTNVFLNVANLNVLLFQNCFFFGDLLLLEQFVKFFNLCLKLLNVLLKEKIDKLKQLFGLLCELLNSIKEEDLFEVESLWTLDCRDDQSFNMLLFVLVNLFFVLCVCVNELNSFHVNLERTWRVVGVFKCFSANDVKIVTLFFCQLPFLW